MLPWSRCTRKSSWTTTGTRTTRGCGSRYDAEVHHVNPLCGDEVTLRVTLQGRDRGAGAVADVSYDALGCSIRSQASASVMPELIIGKTVPEAMSLAEEFLRLMQSKGQAGAGRRGKSSATAWRSPEERSTRPAS